MKTYRNLYPQIYDFANLYYAYLKARRNKRYRAEVLEFSANLEEYLIQIQNELIWKTYRTGRYRQFYIYEPKKRLIMALPFRDRVVHHALCNIIEPIFDKIFIYDSYACRRGKGTHAGANRVTQFLRRIQNQYGRVYCFKADISKYFPSIDHRILKEIIERKIKCEDTMWLINEIIDSTGEGRGIPIGNLTSQLFANIYLNELDYFVKHQLKIKFYVRYMDDFVVLHHDKSYLRDVWHQVECFLAERLNLSLNRKTQIFPVWSRGIDFLGYRIWPDFRLVRKANVKRMRRRLKWLKKMVLAGKLPPEKLYASVASWLGYCKHADTYRLVEKIFGEFLDKNHRIKRIAQK